ncbi:MAG: hypothetical protein N2747_06055 [Chitinophagaceae bacterium]|nr:hypothetical protein [Chitinophagaceae bacterium]
MQKKIFLNLNILFFLLWSLQSKAQHFLPKWESGGGLSGFIYQGDLTPQHIGSWPSLKTGIHLWISKPINSLLAFRLSGAYGNLRGDEAIYANPEYRGSRAFRFTAKVWEITPQIVLNFHLNSGLIKSKSFYLHAGAGLAKLNIRRDYSRFNLSHFGSGSEITQGLQADLQQKLPSVRLIIPSGMGIRYQLSPRLSSYAEINYRILFTDYLDGFSQSANPNRDDHYYTITAGLIFSFGKNPLTDCPKTR